MNSRSNLRSYLFHRVPALPSACTSKDGKSGKGSAMWFDLCLQNASTFRENLQETLKYNHSCFIRK